VNRRVRITGAMLLSLTAGCAGNSPWSAAPALPAPASVGAASKSPLEKLKNYGDRDEPQFAKPNVQPPRPSGPQETSFSSDVNGAVNSAWAKTKSAFTIEPKVVHAPDPLSLNSPVGEMGADVYFATARLHESQGNLARADELYRKALEISPNDLTLLVHCARMHDRAGNFDRAEETYRRAIAAHPREAAAYNDLALCLARRNRLTESADFLRKAVQLQGDSVLYRNNLATVLAEMGRTDEALTHLTAAHGPAVANYNLGYLLHKSGRSQEATACLRRALEIDPQMAPAEQLLASIAGRNGVQLVNAGPSRPGEFVGAAPAPQWQSPTFATPAGHQRPQSLPSVTTAAEDWGDAPTPDSLPQLLPPVTS
jgi:tetratricopeptide (TPR) repeat protein